MLQQTRVETVVPYYERFLERFPDVGALADADLEEVLHAWAGLGYYSRARNLWRAAEIVVRDHGGRVPRDPRALESLPGIGRYTSGAIRSIAFREAAPVVDGNATRVLARLLGLRRPDPAELWRAAGELVQGDRPDLLNQAVMELGALVCTPRAPRCPLCPVGRLCAARAAGAPEAFPARARRTEPRAVVATAGLVERRGRRPAVLVVRRPPEGLLGGLWELPSVEGACTARLLDAVLERTGIRTRLGEALGSVQHGFTHRRLTLHLVRLEPLGGRLRGGNATRWCPPGELGALPLSVLARKTFRTAGLPVPR